MAASNALSLFASVFGRRSAVVIGMIHVDALPGTPRNCMSMKEIINRACDEAKTYKKAGVDAVMVENMNDLPYLNRHVGPEITSAMSVICNEVKREVKTMPCGVQILAGANKDALAVAKAAGLEFIRAEGFIFSHVADEGLMNSDAGELLRYRKQIGADDVLVFTDIKKKHSSHAITKDVDIVEMAHAAEFFQSNGIIITGTSTGSPANFKEMVALRDSVPLPILIGSGVTLSNMEQYLSANGMIIGSHFKEDGHWSKPLDYEKIRTFMAKIERMRN
ncbi:predicted protein [Nematostella vectensis]|uniref:Uncharacterized protein n=2 Tax=Nematostella vectensis TaxID=45351 RepID=A7SXZ2_NEMVE|nr:predicted protein [Nematostella vectensis]|eukprot:XP_001623524.1 predicted protein [Nematostella vectensis]